MLKELDIKNFAIIDHLHVEFAPGLNVFTGETGAGKSIVVDALSLALGERASVDLIRTGCQEAVVEAAFELNGRGTAEAAAFLSEQGIAMNSGEDLIVRRVLSSSGKNKVYINGSLANLATLSALGASLADIHGQHEHQSLLSQEHQMELLDSFGGMSELRSALSDDYRRLQGLRKELADLEGGERDRAQREDLLRFQTNEIEASMLRAGEDVDLAGEQKLLANAEKIAGLSRAADEALYASDYSVLSGLKKAMTSLREIAAIDSRLVPVLELCEAGRAQIEETAREVSAYADTVEFDPERLERIGDRLELIQKLKRKYGSTIEEIIEFGSKAAGELERMERSAEEIERLKKEIQAVKSDLTSAARELTKKRASAARELEKRIEAELSHLGMKRTTFTVRVTQEPGEDTLDGHKLGTWGVDHVEFLISPNPGEEPKPLAKIASGGELSRIMLALKAVLVEGDDIPTLVFDEVDAGIGGGIAEEVGKKLKRVAVKRQVFCITHLPQIASMATSHYGVYKFVKKDRTTAEVRLLDTKERVDEIARMLGGKSMTEATIRHAEEMIERGGT
ncbi:MAG TPA: DNA repair protein RecN [Bacteroidota bacterium]|nr:DNA repair protein RecN [Bacteroidota bacterium]HXY55065.1 DNA repair protein RecN [Nitrospirota bacterium]